MPSVRDGGHAMGLAGSTAEDTYVLIVPGLPCWEVTVNLMDQVDTELGKHRTRTECIWLIQIEL